MRPGADLVPVCPHDRSRPSEGHTRGFPYSNNGKDSYGCLGGVGVAESHSRRVLCFDFLEGYRFRRLQFVFFLLFFFKL